MMALSDSDQVCMDRIEATFGDALIVEFNEHYVKFKSVSEDPFCLYTEGKGKYAAYLDCNDFVGRGDSLFDAYKSYLKHLKIYANRDIPTVTFQDHDPTDLYDPAISVDGWLEATTDLHRPLELAYAEWDERFGEKYPGHYDGFRAFMESLGYTQTERNNTYNFGTDLDADVIYEVYEGDCGHWDTHDAVPECEASEALLEWLPELDEDDEEIDWTEAPRTVVAHWVSRGGDPRYAYYDGPRIATSTVEYPFPFYTSLEYYPDAVDEDVTDERTEELKSCQTLNYSELDGGQYGVKFEVDEDYPWSFVETCFNGTINGVPYRVYVDAPYWG